MPRPPRSRAASRSSPEQTGGAARPPGECAWTGGREADFSDDGAVGTEDYLFLTDNWHRSTHCDCVSPIAGGDDDSSPPGTISIKPGEARPAGGLSDTGPASVSGPR